MTDNNDTIAAIATSFGNSGIGIIRISGDRAVEIADEIVRSRSGKSLDLILAHSHTVHYGYITDGDSVIDEVLCTILKSPKSYTAEDTIEISCHGGMYVLNSVLSLILSHGARLAEPGEFTKRAFLNGRIDLSQAESIMDLISSENEFSRKNSLSQLKGSVKDKVLNLRESIIHETAYIEAALDDPEHFDLDDAYNKKLKSIIENILEILDEIILNSDKVRFLKNGINTVIVGKPNVGKSSLLNLLIGYERAIVTSVPGTTRDILNEKVMIDDIVLNIIDTAGIHESIDEVEKIGIKKAQNEINTADLILLMIDSSKPLDEEDMNITKMLDNKACIVILNKTDKNVVLTENSIKMILDCPVVMMSVLHEKGTDQLRSMIKEMFINGEIRDNEIYITNKRQINLFMKAKNSLKLVIDSINNKMSEDTYTVDLMDAYASLGMIIGEDISDDLTDRIFEEFCMGK